MTREEVAGVGEGEVGEAGGREDLAQNFSL